MTMKNILAKATSAMLTITITLGSCIFPGLADNSSATPTVSDYETQLLLKLGIIDEDSLQNTTADITRGEFSEMLTGLMGLAGGGNAIEELYNLGIVNGYGSGSLKETQTITTYEAVKMIICALGYKPLAEHEGGYPLGYVKVAYECDLLKGAVSNVALTTENALRLIIDAGNTEMAAISNAAIFGEADLGGDTMFYTYFDVVRYTGILTANGYTTLDGNACVSDEVIIAGHNLEKGETAADDFIGYHVEAYAYDRDMVDELIVAAPRTGYNEEVFMPAGTNPEITGNLQKFQVKGALPDGTSKRVTVSGYYVLYNGMLYDSMTLDMLRTISADITYIDNDKDGLSEIIRIDEYSTYIIESIDYKNRTIYGKYDGDLKLGTSEHYDKSLNLDADEYNVFVYKSENRPGTFDDLAEGAAISVLKSADNSFVKVYILTESVTGTITGLSTNGAHRVVTIDGNTYAITAEYENLLVADKVEPQVGVKVRAILDLKNNIVDLSLAEDVWNYGYIMRMIYDTDSEAFQSVRIFGQNGKVSELVFGERLAVDGRSVKNDVAEFVSAGIAQNSISGPKEKRQLVRFKSNDTTLTALDTANYFPATEDIDSLREGSMGVTGVFNSGGICMYQGNDVVLAGTDKTVCFTIPTTEAYKNDEAYYGVGMLVGTMGNGNTYSGVDSYNLNEAGAAKVVVRNMDNTANVDHSGHYIFVKEVKTVVDASGSTVKNITGVRLFDGAAYVRNTTLENPAGDAAHTNLADVKFGDTFRYKDKNVDGVGTTLWAAKKGTAYDGEMGTDVLRWSQSEVSGSLTSGTYADSYREYMGVISYADDSHMKLALDANGTGSVLFYIKGKKIYIADCEEETLEELPASRVASYTADKSPNTRAVVYQRSGGVYALVIYTNVF